MKPKLIMLILPILAAFFLLGFGCGIPLGPLAIVFATGLLLANRRRINWRFALTLLFVCAASFVVSAASNAAPATSTASGSSASWINAVIPIAVPLAIAAAKFFVPNLPGWLCPILAPALGALADLFLHFTGAPNMGPVTGALLGSAGVGIREIQDQVKQRLTPSSPASA